MKIWQTALFTRSEASIIAAAQRSINIAYPVDGPNAVAENDPRRVILRGLGHRNDPITAARLERAAAVLTELERVVSAQAGHDFWHRHLGHEPSNHREHVMVDTLVSARIIQQREVRRAAALVDIARRNVGGEHDLGDLLTEADERAHALQTAG